jgi:hypothetical protein
MRDVRPPIAPCLDAIDGGPREAKRGFLCESCWLRLVDALDNLVDLVTHMRSLEHGGGQSDDSGVRTAQLGYWPLAPGPVAADVLFDVLVRTVSAMLRDVDEESPWDGLEAQGPLSFASTQTIEDVAVQTAALVGDLDEVREELVRRLHGAIMAVQLSRQFGRWAARFPLHESEHRVPLIRCRNCQRQRLSWTPPRFFEDEVIVRCEWCGAIEDQKMVEFDLRLLADERKQRRVVFAPSEG